MLAKPRISVVIPAFNEAQHVARAIESVQTANEVIVVDGESEDDTALVAEQCGATVLRSSKGRGIQLSLGANAADGDMLLFLHADCWLNIDAIEQLRNLYLGHAVHSQMPSVFGCFRQRIEGNDPRYRCVEFGNALRAKWLCMPYGDQAVFIDRSTYDLVEGIPPLALMEDVILSLRMRGVAKPFLLNGPVHVSSRRWAARGIVRQTFRNWSILAAFAIGVSPDRLARWYAGTPTSGAVRS